MKIPNPRRELEKILEEIHNVDLSIVKFTTTLAEQDVAAVDDLVTSIAVKAAQISAMTREALGDPTSSTVVRDTRRAFKLPA